MLEDLLDGGEAVEYVDVVGLLPERGFEGFAGAIEVAGVGGGEAEIVEQGEVGGAGLEGALAARFGLLELASADEGVQAEEERLGVIALGGGDASGQRFAAAP